MVNRLIFWLSLAGVILALHLWIQKTRGFDQGCLGLSAPREEVVSGGCAVVNSLPASTLLGVSNAAWGYAFYFALALASFAKITVSARSARRLHAATEIAVSAALVYTGYLVYEMGFVAHEWCVLCLASATLVTTLAVLHGWLRWHGGYVPLADENRTGEFRLGVTALFAAAGALGAVLLFVNRLGTRALDIGDSRAAIARVVGESLPNYIDRAKLREMRPCRFDQSQPELNLAKLVGADSALAAPATTVPVVLFFDPNCPHCKKYFADLPKLAEQLKDRARIVIVPRIGWPQSTAAVSALRLAEGGPHYLALWQRLFELQAHPLQAMSTAQIEAVFREVGLDTANLEQRLADVQPALAARERLSAAAGVDSLPAIFVGGKRVWLVNDTPECIVKLVGTTLANHAAAGQGRLP